MRIVPVHPDEDDRVEQLAAVCTAAESVDWPAGFGITARTVRAWMRYGWDGEPYQYYAGVVDGEVLAAGELWLPLRDNRSSAWLAVAVRPDSRRAGLGSAMFEVLETAAAARGRTVFGSWGWDAGPIRAFAARRGYELKYVGVHRRQTLADLPAARLEALFEHAQAASRDYELVRIAGPLTGEQIRQSLSVVAAINDAPTEGLVHEDEVFTPARVGAYDEAQLARGMRLYRVWAVHRDTAEVAGHTVVVVEQDRPHIGEQHDTTVLPKHRGHRLGLLLKADMLRWLREREPALRAITTDNAASNSHMIAVNERLGYRVVGRQLEFQRVTE